MATTPTELVFHNPNIRLGFHISKMPTLEETFERIKTTPLKSYQIYVSSGRTWQPPKVDVEDIVKARHTIDRYHRYACVHGCLLYNMAGSCDHRADPDFQRKLSNVVTGLTGELDLAAGLGGGVVVHVGSCKDKEKGLFTVSRTVETVLEANSKETKNISKRLGLPVEEFRRSRKVILENAAGEGTKLGSNLDEIATIIEGVKEDVRDQVKVCIDTAHIFGAGQYDMGNAESVVEFFDDFDSKIGLDRLELFHLNDSRVPWGSRKDRHENLAKGFIFGDRREDELDGTEGLKVLIERAEELRIPLVGEPPAKTAEGGKAPGGIWDYEVVKGLVKLEERFCCG